MRKFYSLFVLFGIFYLASCDQSLPTFEDQIIQDVQSVVAMGICDQMPKGSSIGEIHIGSIGPMGNTEFTLVKVDFDVTNDGFVQRIFQKMVYSTEGDKRVLESMAGCKYVKPEM